MSDGTHGSHRRAKLTARNAPRFLAAVVREDQQLRLVKDALNDWLAAHGQTWRIPE